MRKPNWQVLTRYSVFWPLLPPMALELRLNDEDIRIYSYSFQPSTFFRTVTALRCLLVAGENSPTKEKKKKKQLCKFHTMNNMKEVKKNNIWAENEKLSVSFNPLSSKVMCIYWWRLIFVLENMAVECTEFWFQNEIYQHVQSCSM
jgi:hypothetical protein